MADVINSMSSANVIKFLIKVHFELSIITLISDSAKENNNEEIKRWSENNKIRQHITSTYHHKSNGRVERFNRTLGDAIKKQSKDLSLQERVKRAVKVYNQTIHTAIGLTPNEALNENNLTVVKKRHFSNRVEKYKKLFTQNPLEKLNLNDFILVEDPIHKIKGQPKFGKIGEVIGILNNDTYLIGCNKKTSKKHITQPRKIAENDFFCERGGML
ncbi:hypothetical protein NGRA_2473 [Nosema granulosis]|uniref:Integrase catalytic domain-containing protein n=1 Tax=Nosema granulosis TaxID=83296 RepID=A0A9P6GZA3_9MICR|nr:hypothetical protein NGRA_2473 [Nosema granulosis]